MGRDRVALQVVGRYGRIRVDVFPSAPGCGPAHLSACVAGSNKYYSEVPPEREAGEHEIVISLKSGWSQLVPDLEGCELLRQRVTVQSDLTQLIIAGCIAAGAILVLGLLVWLLYKNQDRAKELVSSFASVEGVLTLKIGLEAWYERFMAAVALLCASEPTAFCRDISGDAVFVSQVREYRDKPWVNQTMIPYTPTPNPSHPHPHPHSPARSLPLDVALRVALSCPVISNMCRLTFATQCPNQDSR